MAKKPNIDEIKDMITRSGTVRLNDSIQSLLDRAAADVQKGSFQTQGYVLVSEDYVLVTAPDQPAQ